MENPKFPALLIGLSLLAIIIAVMANKNQFVIFNLGIVVFITGIFLSFSKESD